jgi:FKBP-type peptidyl-prolyl cis-trans isomerase 2
MMKTDIKSFADMEWQLRWKSHYGTHTDCFFARRVNFWRDLFPKALCEKLMDRSIGESVDVSFNVGEIIPSPDPKKLSRIRHSRFDKSFRPDMSIYPRQGRFYPKGILKDISNVFRANVEPFRCAEVNGSDLLVDFNHPLAGTELHVKATIRGIEPKPPEKGGGLCKDWMEIITAGPGMQSRWNGQPTDFFTDNPFTRTDESSDGNFYQKARFVNHIDTTAIEHISALYEKLLNPGCKVLDLMSSWKSHIPPHLKLEKFTGLGLNLEELAKNEQLTDIVIHDLNERPVLPFEDESFDAVICTVSVEYLTDPLTVFEDVGRILKQGGCFVTTFSNRWFPPKVITIWPQLHEFERMGLISEYFLLSKRFEKISTYSVRGLPRPEGDKYYGELDVSDPVYGVWAYKHF